MFVKICCGSLSLCSISSNFTILTLSNAFYNLKTHMCGHVKLPSPVKQKFKCYSPSEHDLPSQDAMPYMERMTGVNR